MSLMLRKSCQTILDNNNLGQFHTEINEASKSLSLVSECGKPLVYIHGISFSRLTPTKDEITYATELFDIFMTKHKNQINKYIQEKAVLNKLPKPENYTGDSFYYKISDHMEFENKDFSVGLYLDNTNKYHVSYVKYYAPRENRPKVTPNFKLDTKLYNAAIKKHKALVTFAKQIDKCNKLREELSTCNI